MSLNGINNPLLSNLAPMHRPETARPSGDRAQQGVANGGVARTDRNGLAPAQNAPARTAIKQTPIAGTSVSNQSAVPVEAPAGTDPALWSVLTTEERNFFAKTAAMGPLTYGRIKAATNPAPPAERGVRLDVRA